MFGKWLKEQRLNAGLTQQELATLIGISRFAVVEFETGKRTAGLPALKKISEFFNISIYELRKMMEEK